MSEKQARALRQGVPWKRARNQWPTNTDRMPRGQRNGKGRCEERGCVLRGQPCYLPGSFERADYFFCPDHMTKNGFCWGCLNFWAGTERFDFSLNGLCENCSNDPDLVGYRDDDYEDDYDFEYPDEAYAVAVNTRDLSLGAAQ